MRGAVLPGSGGFTRLKVKSGEGCGVPERPQGQQGTGSHIEFMAAADHLPWRIGRKSPFDPFCGTASLRICLPVSWLSR